MCEAHKLSLLLPAKLHSRSTAPALLRLAWVELLHIRFFAVPQADGSRRLRATPTHAHVQATEATSSLLL